MGEVYQTEDLSLERKVALKFLPTDLQQDETARKRFLREAKSAAALDHPYICHIHEAGRLSAFFEIRALTFGAVSASMIAYLSAQFCDVYTFHWIKDLTKGRYLWLRNNGSTLTSQLIDTVAVILITHYWAGALPIQADEPVFKQLLIFIWSGYLFKLTAALLDTGPAYLAVGVLSKYLRIRPID